MIKDKKINKTVAIGLMILSPIPALIFRDGLAVLTSFVFLIYSIFLFIIAISDIKEEQKLIKTGKKAIAKFVKYEVIGNDYRNRQYYIYVIFTDDDGNERKSRTNLIKNINIDDYIDRQFNIAYNDEERIVIIDVIDNQYEVVGKFIKLYMEYTIQKCAIKVNFIDKNGNNRTAITNYIYTMSEAESLINKKLLMQYDEDLNEIIVKEIIEEKEEEIFH
jgi:hypothetical protein